jgi:hypothetical protein
LPHTAQRIAGVPRPHQPVQLHQPLAAVDVLRVGAAYGRLEHLAQRGSEVLREARGGAVGGLADQYAIAVVAVGALLAVGGGGQDTVERIVAVARRAVREQIARQIVAPAGDLVRRVVAPTFDDRTVRLDLGAVAGQVVGTLVAVAIAFDRTCT